MEIVIKESYLELGLSNATDAWVLAILDENKDDDKVSSINRVDVAEALRCTIQAVSYSLARLEKKGLIKCILNESGKQKKYKVYV